MEHQGVDDHVAGAGIEGKAIFEGSVGGNDGHVGYPAYILEDTASAGMSKEGVVEQRNERSALAACCHVGGAEVGDDGDADSGGDEGRFPGLPSAGKSFACIEVRGGLVVEGLAVAAYQIKSYGMAFERGGNGVRVGQAKAPI